MQARKHILSQMQKALTAKAQKMQGTPFQGADGQKERNVLGSGRKRSLKHLRFCVLFCRFGDIFLKEKKRCKPNDNIFLQ